MDGITYASGRIHSVSDDWKNEDDIKADLRVLTAELRRLREELRSMVTPPPKHNQSRAFLHRQSWPSSPANAPDSTPDRNRPAERPARPRRKKNR